MFGIRINHKSDSSEIYMFRRRILMPLSGVMVLLVGLLLFASPSKAANSQAPSKSYLRSELSSSRLQTTKVILENEMHELNLRIDNQNKRLDDQNSHLDHILSLMGNMLTGLAIVLSFAGLIGYVQVQRKAREESQRAASKWFEQHASDLISHIDAVERDLLKMKGKAENEINSQVQGVYDQAAQARQGLQKYINKSEQAPEISQEAANALDEADQSAKRKPETQYTFEDWENRAFAAYGRGDKDGAARYWRAAADTPDANSHKVARSLLNSGITLGELKRPESVVIYEEIIRRFGEAKEPALRELVSIALVNNGAMLDGLERHEEAIKNYDKVIQKFDEPAFAEHLARALLNKGISLNILGRNEEAIEVYNELLGRFSESIEVPLRRLVSMAMVNKGAVLYELGRNEESIACNDEMLRRFVDASVLDAELSGPIAQAFINKGLALSKLGRNEEAVAIYDEMLQRFIKSTEPVIHRFLPMVMLNKGVALSLLNRKDDAVRSYDELLSHYGDATEPELINNVALAMVNKGNNLGELGHYSDAISTFDEMLKRFGDSTDSSIKTHVANAYNGIGFVLLCDAKKAWKGGNKKGAIDLLNRALENIEISLKSLSDSSVVLGNKGYILFLLGDTENARMVLSRAFALGGKDFLRDELKDIDIHTLPQDEAFKAMIEDL